MQRWVWNRTCTLSVFQPLPLSISLSILAYKLIVAFLLSANVPLFICTLGCVRGDVRLVNGTNVTSSVPREGRVEVCINGTFGSVCNKRWDSLDAGVVCRQLGYSSTGMD